MSSKAELFQKLEALKSISLEVKDEIFLLESAKNLLLQENHSLARVKGHVASFHTQKECDDPMPFLAVVYRKWRAYCFETSKNTAKIVAKCVGVPLEKLYSVVLPEDLFEIKARSSRSDSTGNSNSVSISETGKIAPKMKMGSLIGRGLRATSISSVSYDSKKINQFGSVGSTPKVSTILEEVISPDIKKYRGRSSSDSLYDLVTKSESMFNLSNLTASVFKNMLTPEPVLIPAPKFNEPIIFEEVDLAGFISECFTVLKINRFFANSTHVLEVDARTESLIKDGNEKAKIYLKKDRLVKVSRGDKSGDVTDPLLATIWFHAPLEQEMVFKTYQFKNSDNLARFIDLVNMVVITGIKDIIKTRNQSRSVTKPIDIDESDSGSDTPSVISPSSLSTSIPKSEININIISSNDIPQCPMLPPPPPPVIAIAKRASCISIPVPAESSLSVEAVDQIATFVSNNLESVSEYEWQPCPIKMNFDLPRELVDVVYEIGIFLSRSWAANKSKSCYGYDGKGYSHGDSLSGGMSQFGNRPTVQLASSETNNNSKLPRLMADEMLKYIIWLGFEVKQSENKDDKFENELLNSEIILLRSKLAHQLNELFCEYASKIGTTDSVISKKIMVPYEELSKSDKDCFDADIVLILETIFTLGYRIISLNLATTDPKDKVVSAVTNIVKSLPAAYSSVGCSVMQALEAGPEIPIQLLASILDAFPVTTEELSSTFIEAFGAKAVESAKVLMKANREASEKYLKAPTSGLSAINRVASNPALKTVVSEVENRGITPPPARIPVNIALSLKSPNAKFVPPLPPGPPPIAPKPIFVRKLTIEKPSSLVPSPLISPPPFSYVSPDLIRRTDSDVEYFSRPNASTPNSVLSKDSGSFVISIPPPSYAPPLPLPSPDTKTPITSVKIGKYVPPLRPEMPVPTASPINSVSTPPKSAIFVRK